MSGFNYAITNLPEKYEFYPQGLKECFLLPKDIAEHNAKLALSLIRNSTSGYWFRLNRELIKFGEFDINSVTPPPEMKYIVTSTQSGKEQIYIFPKSVNHDCFSQVVNEFRETVDISTDTYQRTISAGFTDLEECYGRSETLNKDSREEDTALLLHFLKGS